MIKVSNLTMIHRIDCKVLIKDLSFSVENKDRLCIIGDEGTGKSSLLKYLMNIPLDYMEFKGEYFCSYGNMGYLPQFLDEKFLDLSIEE